MAEQGEINVSPGEGSSRAAPGQPSGILAGLSTGETLIVIGGALGFGLSFVVMQVLLEEYYNWELAWVAALGALLAVWFRHRNPGAGWTVPYGTVLLVLGTLALAIQAYGIIYDLRAGLGDAAHVIGALSAYAGGVLIFVGALMHTGKL